jgi:hypothetical protein
MCWKGRISWGVRAAEDIRTRKIVSLDLKTNNYVPYYCRKSKVVYEVGNTYYASIHTYPVKDDCTCDCNIHEGLHSYDWNVPFRKERGKWYKTRIHGWSLVFMDYIDHRSDEHTTPVMVECIIPKGTLYYKNHQGEIVSEALKIVKIIDVDEEGNTVDEKTNRNAG